jgi:hypothetical protein
MNRPEDGSSRDASLGQTVKAVLWAFLGIRKRRDLENDAAHLNPLHLIIVALCAVAVFVGTLIMIVRHVVS